MIIIGLPSTLHFYYRENREEIELPPILALSILSVRFERRRTKEEETEPVAVSVLRGEKRPPYRMQYNDNDFIDKGSKFLRFCQTQH